MRGSLKQLFEIGPLVVFFYYFIKTGEIQEAILPLMIAAGIAIFGSYISVSYTHLTLPTTPYV